MQFCYFGTNLNRWIMSNILWYQHLEIFSMTSVFLRVSKCTRYVCIMMILSVISILNGIVVYSFWSRDRLFGTFCLFVPTFLEILIHMAKYRSISLCAHGRMKKIINWPQIRHWPHLFHHFDRDILFGTFFQLGCFNGQVQATTLRNRSRSWFFWKRWCKWFQWCINGCLRAVLVIPVLNSVKFWYFWTPFWDQYTFRHISLYESLQGVW